jgi:hypothetical protein
LKVLIDYHHGDLFYSLQLLFEKRLDWEVYRPIGVDWYHQKYWNVFDHIDTARQFLAIGDTLEDIWDQHPGCHYFALNQDAKEVQPGVFGVYDPTKHALQMGITLEAFKETKFDLLISSIPQHIGPYNRLIQQYQPQAKHVFQVGNAWGHLPGVKNILASTSKFPVPSNINACFYHQEFDLDVFRYEPPTVRNAVNSYIHWMHGAQYLKSAASRLPDWVFRTHGAGMDEDVAKTADIAEKMRASTFTWHYKPGGDGYGHILHNTFACGRPPLVWAPDYRGKLAERLLVDRETCIDASVNSLEENVRLMRHYSQPEEHNRMCENVHKKFTEVVNFDEDEQRIRKFLDSLQ